MTMRIHKAAAIGALLVLSGVQSTHAALFTFDAFDAGASTFGAATNAQAEAALFDAQAAGLGAVNAIDFSGVLGADDSRFLSIPEAQLAPGVSVTVTDGDPGTPDGMLNTSGGITAWSSPSAWSETSPEYILFGEFGVGEPASALTFNFADPVNFFGAYFWLGDFGAGNFTVNFDNGSSQTINLPSGPSGIGFVGFIDDMNLVSSVEFRTDPISNSLNLGVAIDDVRFGVASSVPEPGSLALLGLGLAAFGVRRQRQRG